MNRLWLIGILLLVLAGGVAAQDTPTISPALEDNLTAIETLTSSVRHLDIITPVERRFPTRQDIVDYFTRLFQEELTDELAWQETQFYVAFDLLPADVDLRAVYLAFLTSPAGVAGFYDTETKDMNVLLLSGDVPDDSLPFLEQITYAHEFTHALQDQHFSLDALDLGNMDNPDATLAALSLVEGDATASMTLFMQSLAQDNPMLLVGVLLQGFSAGAFTLPEDAPEFIVTEQLFAYEAGMGFVNRLRIEGGWDLVDATYSNPPISTEQIMHPDKYLENELPQEVTLPDLTDQLGAGWQLTIDRPLGEFYLSSHLKTQLDGVQANAAAAGWGGDRYHIYTDAESGQRAWALRLVWDTPEDAAEFTTAYTAWGDAKYGDAAFDGACWTTEAETRCMLADDSGTMIASAPTPDMARLLLAGSGE
ncbi:MAG: hypothetical protein H6672_15835 [Anaerolineaceae bacterium]|nr:hypothetical protein [Anaerolineaceae bacterium]